MNHNAMSPLLIAVGAIIFYDIVMPLLTALLDTFTVKLNKFAVRDQVEATKLSNSLEEEPPVHAIGFHVDSEDDEVDDDE